MGRYTGPTERLSRREGVELFLKGERALNGKSGLERRGPNPPGQHGAARRRQPSIYATQMREKQRAKRYYGVRERQFRRYVKEASRGSHADPTGTRLLALLERRLDNVVYRLGFATTRAQARQFVSHGHILVDGKRVDIPSFSVKPEQVISIKPESPVRPVAQDATELTSTVVPWLQADLEGLAGRVLRLPIRSEIPVPVDEQLIVEFYARR
jgi:small subunit ribosomal protein S4